MASKGYGNLWIMAIGLIGIFVLATVVVPELTGHGQTGTNDGWNSDMPSGEAKFNAPTASLSASEVWVNQGFDLSVKATPTEDTTGEGGIYAWIFQLDAVSSDASVADLKYGNGASAVEWNVGSDGSIVGVGPRFVQGPGAVSMEVSSSLAMSISKQGSHSLRVWLAESRSATDLNPDNYTSVSPMKKVPITVSEPVNAAVTVDQIMSVPAGNLTNDTWSSFRVTTAAVGTGGWSEPIAVYVAIEKKNIKASDVSIRVNPGSGYADVEFTDEGDQLVALVATKTALSGAEDPESASWTTNIQLSFAVTGSYVLTSWAEDRTSGDELSLVTYDTLQVDSPVVVPEPTPTPDPTPVPDPNATGGNETAEVTPVVPVNNSSTTPAATGRNNGV